MTTKELLKLMENSKVEVFYGLDKYEVHEMDWEEGPDTWIYVSEQKIQYDDFEDGQMVVKCGTYPAHYECGDCRVIFLGAEQ